MLPRDQPNPLSRSPLRESLNERKEESPFARWAFAGKNRGSWAARVELSRLKSVVAPYPPCEGSLFDESNGHFGPTTW